MSRTILLFLIGIPFISNSQTRISTFQYLGEPFFDNELYLGVAVRNMTLTFPKAPRPENHGYNIWTGDFQLYRTNLEAGKTRYMFRNKVLGEIFFAFGAEFNEIYRTEGSTFSHFLIGAHDIAWNITVQDRWALAAGFNLTDLVTGSTLIEEDEMGNETMRFTPAPHGWYIGAGPSVFSDFLLSDYFLLELQASHTFHFTNPVPLTYGIDSPNQIMPQQSFLSITLLSTWGFYLSVETSALWDRNEYNLDGYKFDGLIGFKIML